MFGPAEIESYTSPRSGRMVEEAWRELGRLYIEKARRLDPWRATIHGIAHTLLRRVDKDREAIGVMLELSPSPEKTSCPINPSKLARLGFYSPTTVSKTICDKVRHADEWVKSLKDCNRNKLRLMKMEGRNVLGLSWKGIDMTLLDAGCDIPVIDIHMARFMAREDPEFLKEMELDKYDPEAVDKRIRVIQNSNSPTKYDKLWERAVKRAISEGLPPGEWHVAVWLRERFRNEYPRLSEDDRIEIARKYIEKLFS